MRTISTETIDRFFIVGRRLAENALTYKALVPNISWRLFPDDVPVRDEDCELLVDKISHDEHQLIMDWAKRGISADNY